MAGCYHPAGNAFWRILKATERSYDDALSSSNSVSCYIWGSVLPRFGGTCLRLPQRRSAPADQSSNTRERFARTEKEETFALIAPTAFYNATIRVCIDCRCVYARTDDILRICDTHCTSYRREHVHCCALYTRPRLSTLMLSIQ